MTTYDINEAASPERGFSLGAWLAKVTLAWRKKAHRRRATLELSAMDARLLRDIGLDWEDVHDGIVGRRRAILLNPLPRDRAKNQD
jgi:uncharacterized protein YjiS (DUF1127 family)